MTEGNERRVFGAVEVEAEDAREDWRAVPRSKMFGRVIVAVDGAKGEAEDLGDTHFVRYIDAVLFPFLEAELEAARMAEESSAGSSYRDVFEELVVEKGFSGAEEVARRAVELDPSYTVEELLEAPPGGFGTALDAVLHMSDAEKARIAASFTRTFLSPARLKKTGD